jgi:hypothetical protein
MARREASEESISNTFTKTAITNLDRDSVTTKNNEPMLTEIGRRVLEYKKKNNRLYNQVKQGDYIYFW